MAETDTKDSEAKREYKRERERGTCEGQRTFLFSYFFTHLIQRMKMLVNHWLHGSGSAVFPFDVFLSANDSNDFA